MSTIQLTTEQQETLTRIAVQAGKLPSEVLQMALSSIEQKLAPGNGAASETVREAMLQLGLLGCVTDAPADLSTNPTYMEGFGTNGR